MELIKVSTDHSSLVKLKEKITLELEKKLISKYKA